MLLNIYDASRSSIKTETRRNIDLICNTHFISKMQQLQQFEQIHVQ